MKPIMKCGHAANALVKEKPVCAICFNIVDGAEEVDNDVNLENRVSVCLYCGHSAESNPSLPFFKYKPTKELDSHYCGCRGWE